jgi:hypothetical protein
LGLQLPFTCARIVGDGGRLLALSRADLGRPAPPPLPLVAMPAGAGVSRDFPVIKALACEGLNAKCQTLGIVDLEVVIYW